MTQAIPFWTGFHRLLSENRPDVTVVTYPPIIDAKPTNIYPQYLRLWKNVLICQWTLAKSMLSKHLINNFMRQFSKYNGQGLISLSPTSSDWVVFIVSLLIFALDKLWADWGLRDLLVDYDVYAGNTVEQMLTGKQFNRAVRGFTLVFNSINIIYI